MASTGIDWRPAEVTTGALTHTEVTHDSTLLPAATTSRRTRSLQDSASLPSSIWLGYLLVRLVGRLAARHFLVTVVTPRVPPHLLQTPSLVSRARRCTLWPHRVLRDTWLPVHRPWQTTPAGNDGRLGTLAHHPATWGVRGTGAPW